MLDCKQMVLFKLGWSHFCFFGVPCQNGCCEEVWNGTKPSREHSWRYWRNVWSSSEISLVRGENLLVVWDWIRKSRPFRKQRLEGYSVNRMLLRIQTMCSPASCREEVPYLGVETTPMYSRHKMVVWLNGRGRQIATTVIRTGVHACNLEFHARSKLTGSWRTAGWFRQIEEDFQETQDLREEGSQ